MNTKTLRLAALLLAFLWLGGCNVRDLNQLEDVADDHAGRLARLKQMIIEAEQQIGLINKLLVEYDGRLTVTGMGTLDDGNYYVRFSDGDSITVNGGQTPVIELSGDKTWIINGYDTGVPAVGKDAVGEIAAPAIRQQNGKWEISEDGGRTWRDTGVKVKGTDGEDGMVPVISVGDNGNWYIDGGDTGYPLQGGDGKTPAAPRVKVLDNGNWAVKNGDSDWVDTGVPASGRDGEDAENGTGTPYIQSVSVAGTKVSFHFSANIPGISPATNVITVTRQVDFSYTILEDGKWVTLPSRPMAIPIGGVREIKFKITLPPGEEWGGRQIVLPDGFVFQGEKREGSSGTLNETISIRVDLSVGEYRSGLVFLTIVGRSGKQYVTLIPVATALYHLDVLDFDFADSYVYRVYNDAGEQVAEICREYIYSRFSEAMRTVIYPYDEATLSRGVGMVTGMGGTMDPVTAIYNPAGNYPAGRHDVYFLSSTSFVNNIESYMQAILLKKENFVPERMYDASGDGYKIAKIGTHYWMAEDLASNVDRNGKSIPELSGADEWAATSTPAYCLGRTSSAKYSWLYNGYAVASGDLAPAGWRIPTTEEWRMLELYMGGTESGLDAEGWHTLLTVEALKGTEWSPVWRNKTGFDASPSGKRSVSGAFSTSEDKLFACWASDSKGQKLGCREINAVKAGQLGTFWVDKQEGLSVRCVRDVFVKGNK